MGSRGTPNPIATSGQTVMYVTYGLRFSIKLLKIATPLYLHASNPRHLLTSTVGFKLVLRFVQNHDREIEHCGKTYPEDVWYEEKTRECRCSVERDNG
jgi:hypothetical protein